MTVNKASVWHLNDGGGLPHCYDNWARTLTGMAYPPSICVRHTLVVQCMGM